MYTYQNRQRRHLVRTFCNLYTLDATFSKGFFKVMCHPRPAREELSMDPLSLKAMGHWRRLLPIMTRLSNEGFVLTPTATRSREWMCSGVLQTQWQGPKSRRTSPSTSTNWSPRQSLGLGMLIVFSDIHQQDTLLIQWLTCFKYIFFNIIEIGFMRRMLSALRSNARLLIEIQRELLPL